MKFTAGDLVRITSPKSLEEMNIVGIITNLKYPSRNWFEVWIPDLGREIAFDKWQLKKIEQ